MNSRGPGLIRRAAVAAGAAVVLLGLTAGVASAAGTAVLSWSPTTSPGTFNFGTVNAGQKVSQALTLTNSGGKATGALTVTLAGSPAFTKTADTCTGANLSSKKSCRVTVQYAPTTPGQADSATLTGTGKTGTASLALAGAAAKASPALATRPGAGGTVGSTTVTDTATLSNGVGPAGAIEFKLYGPSATADCSTTPVHDESIPISGNGSYTTPAGFIPSQAGAYWWTASYRGDTGNNPASSGCGAESVTISKASPAIGTSAGAGGTVGATVTDTATLAGGHNPTGTIEFKAYGPSAATSCSTTAVFDKFVMVSGDGSYTSPSFTPVQAGTYWWSASYGGDANNTPVASGCDQEQVTLTKASPAFTTAPAASGAGMVGATMVTDTATLPDAYHPTGTIEFKAYGPSAAADCTTAPVDEETVSVTGDGSYTTPVGFAPTQAGTYWWTASYGGDPNNNTAAAGCGDESVTIAKASPAVSTSPGAGGTVGATAVTDTATLAGGYNATGAIDFTLYGPGATADCTTAPVFDEAVPVSGDGAYTSPSFTPAQAGTYYWVASYGGDTNNNPAATNCGDESVIITPPSHLYWANHFGQGGGTINEAGLDGGNPHAIVTGNEPFGVAVDLSHLYWADMLTGTINEANLDGSNNHAIVTGQNEPAAVAVDDSHIYWANFGTSTINEAGLDGTGVTTLITGQDSVFGLAVDSGHLYWANFTSAGTIKKAGLDGTGVTTLLSGLNSPYGVAVDSSHLYWTSVGGTGTINQAGLDGSNTHAIVSGQGTPVGVAVDSGHLYWANGVNNTGTISKANLDGTGVTILATGQQTPRGVAVGPQ